MLPVFLWISRCSFTFVALYVLFWLSYAFSTLSVICPWTTFFLFLLESWFPWLLFRHSNFDVCINRGRYNCLRPFCRHLSNKLLFVLKIIHNASYKQIRVQTYCLHLGLSYVKNRIIKHSFVFVQMFTLIVIFKNYSY